MHLLLTVLGILVVVPVAAAATWIGYSALFVSHRVPLPPALSGDRREFARKAGQLSYYCSAPAAISQPMLLIHSVNAAASAYEVRPLFEHYRKIRTVYALDLPGFGFSDRGDRAYTPRLMTDAILAMVSEIAPMGTLPWMRWRSRFPVNFWRAPQQKILMHSALWAWSVPPVSV